MTRPLRVLIVEDSEADAQLLLRELRAGGYDPSYQRVASGPKMAAALAAEPWDVVISDHSMPQFSAPAALRVLKEAGIDLPFIIVSGAIGEDIAVEAMRAGAHDFLSKGRLARLVPAVERELGEAEVRRAKRAAEEDLRKLNAELERRVAERTAELKAANSRLAELLRERQALLDAEQRARRQAELATAARDEFISIAAHELKTPVTSLQGFAQLTQRELGRSGSIDPARLDRTMKRIEQQSKRLTRLTEQLLNLSRLQSSKLTLSREETSLSALARRVIADMHDSHPERVIELQDQAIGPAMLDPLRIEQVLVNLLDNAIKFSPPDSVIDVDVTRTGPEWVKVSVRDRGIGIGEEKREHIFERFFQAHPERHYGGMGIGLFVSREIVEMHGGTIVVEQPEDGGSRFVVRLPASGNGSERADVGS